MIENTPVRIGNNPTLRTEWFARFDYPAWTLPTIDPYSYEDKHTFMGVVGRMTPDGFDPCIGNQEIALFVGCCSGVFYAGEVVPVVKWPFNTQPLYHNYKWMARGLGMLTCWTEKEMSSSWRIDDGPTINQSVLAQHYISEKGESFDERLGNNFPGMGFPYARTPGQLEGEPVKWFYCGAEGVFTPIVQTPNH